MCSGGALTPPSPIPPPQAFYYDLDKVSETSCLHVVRKVGSGWAWLGENNSQCTLWLSRKRNTWVPPQN